MSMPNRKALPRDAPLDARLQSHVLTLTETIGERHPGAPENLRRAEDYVAQSFSAAGYETQAHEFTAGGQTLRNLIAVRPGLEPAIVVGAHFDSVPGSPGADDNASGTAVLLELAGRAKEWPAGRKLYFVAFTNEEAPSVKDMGSYRYVRFLKENRIAVSKMICLEMVGYYDDKKGSQRYPAGLNVLYPSRGNFVALVSNVRSWPLLRALRGPLNEFKTLPVSAAVLPSFIGGIDRSDHVNFWNAGIPAVMISDTAFYRNPHYHLPSDTGRRLDYHRMAQLTRGLDVAIQALASTNK
jgi:Zn-dependent M28 family amino/carboxypeptidase